MYGGWWDGDPSRLKPAPSKDLAREIASLAGRRLCGARQEARGIYAGAGKEKKTENG
jgi:alkyl sulfatase BDS1-like metallo-beta-lactamase superfamily hydrolase